MNTSRAKPREPDRAVGLTFTDVSFTVALADGRYVTIPLWWYPRLEKATAARRNQWKLLGDGLVVQWSYLDEFIEVEHLVRGVKSVELKDLTPA